MKKKNTPKGKLTDTKSVMNESIWEIQHKRFKSGVLYQDEIVHPYKKPGPLKGGVMQIKIDNFKVLRKRT